MASEDTLKKNDLLDAMHKINVFAEVAQYLDKDNERTLQMEMLDIIIEVSGKFTHEVYKNENFIGFD